MSGRQDIERGFTLLEVIVAMLILAIITTTTWYSFDGIVRMREVVEATEVTTNTARVALNRIARELSCAFLTRNPSPTSAYLTVFRGMDEDPMDRVIFNSFSHVRLYRNSAEADGTEITYSTEADPDAPGLYLLLHREAERIDGQPDEGGVIEILARRVAYLNFRYYDYVKEEWSDYWDSLKAEHQRRTPKAVEVSLTLVDDDGGEHSYATVIPISMYRTAGNQGPIPDMADE